MEIWDAYDERLQLIPGISLAKGDMIPNGMFHLVCDVIVRHRDGTYLLMQRANSKSYGGMWEATAGGSAHRGESPLGCAIRELREETGIAADSLCEVGHVIHPLQHAIFVEYLCVTDQAKDTVVLQEGETQDYRWVTPDILLYMRKQDRVTDRMQLFLDALQV